MFSRSIKNNLLNCKCLEFDCWILGCRKGIIIAAIHIVIPRIGSSPAAVTTVLACDVRENLCNILTVWRKINFVGTFFEFLAIPRFSIQKRHYNYDLKFYLYLILYGWIFVWNLINYFQLSRKAISSISSGWDQRRINEKWWLKRRNTIFLELSFRISKQLQLCKNKVCKNYSWASLKRPGGS